MTLIRQMTIAVLLAGFGGAEDIQYNFDHEAEFSRFKFYRWIALPQSQNIDPLLANDIREAFDAALTRKGLTKTTSRPPISMWAIR